MISIHRRLDWLLPKWLEDPNAFAQNKNLDISTIFQTFFYNFLIFLCCLLFFSIYRQYNEYIFSPKVDLLPENTLPRMPNDSLFGWIRNLWNIS